MTGYTSINACVKAELFPTGIRALGVALPYAIANALFGGTAEYVALWFKDAGIESGYYWYVMRLRGRLADRLPVDARDPRHRPEPGQVRGNHHGNGQAGRLTRP